MLLFASACAGNVNRPKSPTLTEIVQLSRDKTPAEEIIRRLRDSRAIYALPASQLAQLHDQGVADSVLDYMQATYLQEVRRDEAFRQWQSGWPWGPGYGWYGPRGW